MIDAMIVFVLGVLLFMGSVVLELWFLWLLEGVERRTRELTEQWREMFYP